MSKYDNNQTKSRRKPVKPIIDFNEIEDDARRDLSGRKRVDVIECLLDSSSDDNEDDKKIINQNKNSVLWLTFAEICHIRYVLAQTTFTILKFNKDKQYSKLINGDLCFRCRTSINSLDFLPSFLYSKNVSTCYVCEQTICTNCSLSNFLPPLSKHFFPVRVQTLMKISSTAFEKTANQKDETNPKAKTICYDCLQVGFRFK